MPSGHVYSVYNNQSSPGTNPLIEITAGEYPLEILRVTVAQGDQATSNQAYVYIQRTSTSGSGGTSYTPRLVYPGVASADASAKTGLSGLGSAGDILISQGFNILAGFFYYPHEDERIIVDTSGILVVRFATTPASAIYTTTVVFKEL